MNVLCYSCVLKNFSVLGQLKKKIFTYLAQRYMERIVLLEYEVVTTFCHYPVVIHTFSVFISIALNIL